MTKGCFSALLLAVGAGLGGCGTGPIDAFGLASDALSADLVAHWSFDEGTGSMVGDSSGHAYHGVLNGTSWSWLPEGRFSAALHLEQGDYVMVDNFPNATPGWTVAVWVRFSAQNVAVGEVTVLSTENVFKGGWEINLTDTERTYHFGFFRGPNASDYTYCNCDGCIRPDEWQHLAAVVDGAAGTLAFYLDGVLQTQQAIPQSILPGVPTLYMGRWATKDPPRLFVGSLDDVGIWSRALPAEEVVRLTQAPAP
jgi:hypothetical protein